MLAGGRRAHLDHHRRTERNADYIIGNAVLELKILEDEGLSKLDRQAKLATLFSAIDPHRPVHVLDRSALTPAGQRVYDRAMEGPIKGAVRSAKRQLAQSRSELPETTHSIMMIVNNGNTSLDHDEIVRLASQRVRNDTETIDGVVVAGAYIHSDGFDTLALWPIDYVPITLDWSFPDYTGLRNAFQDYAERAMTEAIMSGPSPELSKGPIIDNGFDLDGITFVKPAPPLGRHSDFYINGRPRLNSTGVSTSPTVGLIFPDLVRSEWQKFRDHMPDDASLGEQFEHWMAEREDAFSQGTSLRPLVAMPITFDGWVESLGGATPPTRFRPVRDYANALFQKQISRVILGAKDFAKTQIVPSRYILAVTELIGQDQANDVSHIFLMQERPGSEPCATPLVENARIFHLHACTLGASYAVIHGVTTLRWRKITTYAWS